MVAKRVGRRIMTAYFTIQSLISGVFNFDATLFDYDAKSVERYNKIDVDGRRYKLYYSKDGQIRKSYMKSGRPDNVLRIPFLQGNSKERTGYPTQKPLALLERIVRASSKTGDLVLDPFCGCATTCVAANRLGSRLDWNRYLQRGWSIG